MNTTPKVYSVTAVIGAGAAETTLKTNFSQVEVVVQRPLAIIVSPNQLTPPSNDRVVVSVQNKDSVTILKGQPVAVHPSGIGVVLAGASNNGKNAYGVALTDAGPLQMMDVLLNGRMALPDWTNATGTITLLPKGRYFLSNVDGLLTTAPPQIVGQVVQHIGDAVSPTELDVQIEPPVLL